MVNLDTDRFQNHLSEKPWLIQKHVQSVATQRVCISSEHHEVHTFAVLVLLSVS